MSQVLKSKPENEFFTPEHCHILELVGVKDDPACSIARARVEPGTTTQLHSLSGIAERYVILEGTGLILKNA
jgi:hypothetical protein